MKKITLLLFFIACVVLANAQTNLLTNPGFETWTNGTAPDGWTMGTSTYATVSASTTLFNEGTRSIKVTATTPATSGGTYTMSQAVPVIAGKTYTIIMNYYIENGDGTDARIWCNFKNASGTYWKMNLADSLAMKGPNATATTGYFPDVKGSWQTYTYSVVAPVGYEILDFSFRTYKAPAVVYWDNMYFGEKTTGLSTPSADKLSVTVAGKKLTVTNAPSSNVEIFNTLGKKVQSLTLVNGSANLNLPKGIYFVRAGEASAKFKL